MSVHFTEQYFSIRPQTWRSLIVYHDKNHFHASVRKSVSVSANFFLVKFADVFLDWTKLKHCFKLTWENSSTKVCSYEVTVVKKKKNNKKNHILKFSQIRFCEWRMTGTSSATQYASEFLLPPSFSSIKYGFLLHWASVLKLLLYAITQPILFYVHKFAIDPRITQSPLPQPTSAAYKFQDKSH